MDAISAPAVATSTPARATYSSPPHVLIRSFRLSRDRWKDKHQRLKADLKYQKNRIADLTKSRDRWRQQAEQARLQVAALNAQLAPVPRLEPPPAVPQKGATPPVG
jgi:septal ring factor EnvC (AmiA/AmiB activator)